MQNYKLDKAYKLLQHQAHISRRRKVAVWPASKGQAFRLDKADQPKGEAAIKAAKKLRTRFFKEKQV